MSTTLHTQKLSDVWDLKDKKSLLGAKHIRRKLTFKETERFHKKSHFFSNHEKFRTKNCKVNYRSYWINCKENAKYIYVHDFREIYAKLPHKGYISTLFYFFAFVSLCIKLHYYICYTLTYLLH